MTRKHLEDATSISRATITSHVSRTISMGTEILKIIQNNKIVCLALRLNAMIKIE